MKTCVQDFNLDVIFGMNSCERMIKTGLKRRKSLLVMYLNTEALDVRGIFTLLLHEGKRCDFEHPQWQVRIQADSEGLVNWRAVHVPQLLPNCTKARYPTAAHKHLVMCKTNTIAAMT